MSEAEPQPPRGKRPTSAALLTVAVVAAGSAAYAGWLQTEQQQAATRSQAAQRELAALKQSHEALQQQHQQLQADRDNLLTQVKRTIEEGEQAVAERGLMQQAYRQTAGDRVGLRQRLLALEAQHQDLLQLHDALMEDYRTLEQQLEKSRARSEEKRLKEALSQQERKSQEAQAAAKDAESHTRELQARQEKLQGEMERLGGRFERLQSEYASLFADHRVLREKSKRMPKDVTQLAKEHERLIKDTAATHYNMGVLFSQRKDFVRAEKEFQRVAEINPSDAQALYNLGIIYAEHLPDRERAARYFERYLTLQPTGKDANWVKAYLAEWRAWEVQERLE